MGYTHIEIMIVVAIIGVVAFIAYLSYWGYLADAYRAQVALDLKACGVALKRYYSNGFAYAGADTNTICNTNPPTEREAWYIISCETLTSTAFSVRAIPVGESCSDDHCIELNQTCDQMTL